MTLKFGDPDSISLRDKARAEAEAAEAPEHVCESCLGEGEVETTFYCQDSFCDSLSHEITSECPCCDGTGMVQRRKS
jgi:hypothetical protein